MDHEQVDLVDRVEGVEARGGRLQPRAHDVGCRERRSRRIVHRSRGEHADHHCAAASVGEEVTHGCAQRAVRTTGPNTDSNSVRLATGTAVSSGPWVARPTNATTEVATASMARGVDAVWLRTIVTKTFQPFLDADS